VPTAHRDELRSADRAGERLSPRERRDLVGLAVQHEERPLEALQLGDVVVGVPHEESRCEDGRGERPEIGEGRLEDERRDRASGGEARGDATAE